MIFRGITDRSEIDLLASLPDPYGRHASQP
jgi:hypothetical protein